MIYNSKMDIEKINATVVEARLQYIKNMTEDKECKSLSDDDITQILASVEEKLGMQYDGSFKKISYLPFYRAFQLLVYVAFCPPKFEMDLRRKAKEESIILYKPKEVLLIMNRMLHSERNNPYYW